MSPSEAWPLLTDIARVAPCVPGAKLKEAVDADAWRGELAVRVGPVGMRFVGEMRFVARDAEAGTARAEGSAQDARNRASVDARIHFRLSPAASRSFSELTYECRKAIATEPTPSARMSATAASISLLIVQPDKLARHPCPAVTIRYPFENHAVFRLLETIGDHTKFGLHFQTH